MAVTGFLLLSLGLAVTAQALNCSTPVPGPNMSLRDTDILLQTFPDGTTVSFTCNVGYRSAGGSATITCTAGSWSPVRLRCERKNCGSAGEVVNGQVDYPQLDTLFGDTAVTTCNPGHTLIGKKTIICGDQGWMSRLPTCEVVACDPPSTVADGTFSPVKESYDYGEVVLYRCRNDFTLNGSKSLSCSDGGRFEPSPPTCVNVQCEELSIKNADWTEGSRPPYRYKATVTYRCRPGFKMIGEGTLICEINSRWSPGIPTCEPQDCPTPVAGPNMSLKGKDLLLQTFPDGTKVTFACDFGFTSAGGSAVSTCTAGSWSPVTLKCEKIQTTTKPTTTTPKGDDGKPPGNDGSSNVGKWIGGAIGAVAALAGVYGIYWFTKRKEGSQSDPTENETTKDAEENVQLRDHNSSGDPTLRSVKSIDD